ncbi:MAG: MBL fold metallo-hydrolase [Acidobacteriota bacterium]
MRAARVIEALGGAGRVAGRVCGALGLKTVAWLVDAAPLALPLFDAFEFGGNDVVLPTRTFVGRLELHVGDRRVELMELGPAHTLGDTVVYLPDERILFTGDLLFKDAHPLIWQGPVSNWLRACDTLLALEVDTVVPGHGPITDLSGIRETREYLEWLTGEARARFERAPLITRTGRCRSAQSNSGARGADPLDSGCPGSVFTCRQVSSPCPPRDSARARMCPLRAWPGS